MMNVTELRDKLCEEILSLGINPNFRENPAFASGIAKIDSMISQLNIINPNDIQVIKNEGFVSFNYSFDGKNNSLKIFSSSPNSFSCMKTSEKKLAYSQEFEKDIYERETIDLTTELRDSGEMAITENRAMINNNCKDANSCMMRISHCKKEYDKNGIMHGREDKLGAESKIPGRMDSYTDEALFGIARSRENNFPFEKREMLKRDKFDTAFFVREDSSGLHSEVVKLSGESGLRDMHPISNPANAPVIITPLSPTEIEQMIQRESNPKVQEGLRNYAVGRESYYYNSLDENEMSRGVSR